jgi:hypothetical protein
MNKPVTVALLTAGVVPQEVLNEMSRWGLPVKFMEVPAEVMTDAKQVIAYIREAVEGDDAVMIRSTDLDVLTHYLGDQRQGKLYLFDPETESTGSLSIVYSILPNGRYVIPWTEESISDLLTYPKSYLKAEGNKVHFDEVEELFFGGVKSFVSAHAVVKAGSV